MPTMQVMSTVDIELAQVIDSVANLELSDLEAFAAEINSLLAQRKAPGLSQRETQLLEIINRGPSVELRQRYALLNEKLQDENLSDKEQAELVRLVEQIEAYDVERLKSLIDLAQLRGVSLDAVMDQLDIQRSIYA